MGLVLGMTTTNVFAASSIGVKASTKCYARGGSSTTTSSSVGNYVAARSTFVYVSNELNKELTSSTSVGVTGPRSITASAGSKHAICTARKTLGAHWIKGSETFYGQTDAGY